MFTAPPSLFNTCTQRMVKLVNTESLIYFYVSSARQEHEKNNVSKIKLYLLAKLNKEVLQFYWTSKPQARVCGSCFNQMCYLSRFTLNKAICKAHQNWKATFKQYSLLLIFKHTANTVPLKYLPNKINSLQRFFLYYLYFFKCNLKQLCKINKQREPTGNLSFQPNEKA